MALTNRQRASKTVGPANRAATRTLPRLRNQSTSRAFPVLPVSRYSPSRSDGLVPPPAPTNCIVERRNQRDLGFDLCVHHDIGSRDGNSWMSNRTSLPPVPSPRKRAPGLRKPAHTFCNASSASPVDRSTSTCRLLPCASMVTIAAKPFTRRCHMASGMPNSIKCTSSTFSTVRA